ncbi:MAG TPA: hypothetical protein VGL71_01805, partial [Urbifossiella sp.]
QNLIARELEMRARVLDVGSRDPYQRVLAHGPGTLRIWQSGLKDETGPNKPMGPAALAAQPMPPAKESEMKLTIVIFAGRMVARDYGNIYQDALFSENIELMHAPADRDDAIVDRHHLPVGSVRLTCAEKLIVASHKSTTPPTQTLDAYGNADIRTDEYDGWGEKISSNGPIVTLLGGENTLARIKNRFNLNRNNGTKIIYNRSTGEFSAENSNGAQFQQGPPKNAPVPKSPMNANPALPKTPKR